MKGKDNLTLSVGYSHDVVLKIPAGVDVKVGGAKQELVNVSGIDKQAVGQMAADHPSFPQARALPGQRRAL